MQYDDVKLTFTSNEAWFICRVTSISKTHGENPHIFVELFLQIGVGLFFVKFNFNHDHLVS